MWMSVGASGFLNLVAGKFPSTLFLLYKTARRRERVDFGIRGSKTRVSKFNPKSLLKESGHFGLREFCLEASKGILVLVDPVPYCIARLRILCYFVKINQSFTQEIKSYIKRRSFHLLALSITFKQLQMKKRRELGKYFLQLTIDAG